MKVLIIGQGGREHALAWKCASSPRVSEVLVAPGNAGTAAEPRVRNVAASPTDVAALLRLASDERVDLTIVGPEGPLVLGIVDEFTAAGLRCFGPSRACAQLEGSKAFSKEFLHRHGIPTASYRSFTRASFDAPWVLAQPPPIVVKASGLAAGKGVIIASSAAEAVETATAMFDGRFGAAGGTVVIEQFLAGEEASFIVMADGEQFLPFASSQDHKRLADADRGPNTGGMGAYSPAPVVTPTVHERVLREIIRPTLRGLIAEGTPYRGFLYAGLMIGADGSPRVIEFNCRFGDPEAQPVLTRLQSDLTVLCEAALDGHLTQQTAQWDPRPALGVVLAAAGYPDAVRSGDPISGLDAAARLPGKVFHGGTTLAGDRVVTGGGRVLCAVGLGADLKSAQREAYQLVRAIDFAGMQYRHDIGFRALTRSAP
jgi:phosphoribosylamine---glycine ligase